jgi:hypothetical protein
MQKHLLYNTVQTTQRHCDVLLNLRKSVTHGGSRSMTGLHLGSPFQPCANLSAFLRRRQLQDNQKQNIKSVDYGLRKHTCNPTASRHMLHHSTTLCKLGVALQSLPPTLALASAA